MKEQLFDVIIFKIASGEIESIPGKAMKRDSGHYNAEKRFNTVYPRLNDYYSCAIVEAGKYKKGDIYEVA